MGELAIHTTNLSRRFGTVTALQDLNLNVEYGEIHGLLGPNGSGKTTTIRLLLGLLRPSSGRAVVLGSDPCDSRDTIRAHVGAVLEPCGLYENLSAWENLDYFGRIWHIPAAQRGARVEVLLEEMQLSKRKDEIIGGWGRGLKQRLCIARSLLHRPSLLLLDEPNAGLDSPALDAICDMLRRLAEDDGLAVLMATNNLSVAETTCRNVTLLSDGWVVASGSTDQIRSAGCRPTVEVVGRGFTDQVVALLMRRPEVDAAHYTDHTLSLRLMGEVDTAPLVSLLVESGADITEVRRSSASLKVALDALLQQQRGEENNPR